MGAQITAEKIENKSIKKLLKMKASVVNDLSPEVREIYELRMSL